MGKSKRNITGLLHHADALKNDSEERVAQSIDTLKRSKAGKINFRTVSELSGVSTTTLYNNPILRERISSLRAVQKKPVPSSAKRDISEREKIRILQQEIQKLKEDKQMLIIQLVELDQLRQENVHLKAMLNQCKLE